jgi:hypothetical protein
MTDWLNRLPDFGVFAVLIIPSVLAMVAASLLGQRIRRRYPAKPDESSFEIMDAFIAVASAAAVVLAFSLVQVDTNLSKVSDNISKEANAINALDRALLRLGNPGLETARKPLMEYAMAIVKDEWPLLAERDRSERVDEIFRSISVIVRAAEPNSAREIAIFNEALRAMDQMVDYREQRINSAASGLSALFWKAILGIFGLLVVIAYHTDPTRRRVWSMVSISATLSVLLALVVILDSPFTGETTLDADAFEHVMGVMNARR